MQISITLKDNEVQKWLSLAPQQMHKASINIVKKVSLLVERHSKIYSPVDTGRMRASIATDFSDRLTDVQATIQPHTNYAEFVHDRVPFMVTGALQAEQSVSGIVAEEIKKVL